MNEIELIRQLSRLEKSYFTLQDLAKILPVRKKSLYTVIGRLVKKEVLQKARKGIYTVFGKVIIPEEVAPLLYYPSYISLNTVLARLGVINQIPQEVLLVTPKRTKKIKIGQTWAVYRQIKKELFYGWYLEKQIPTAYPEKALLDLAYFSQLGRAYLPLAELDFSFLDKKRWNELKKAFLPDAGKVIGQIEKKWR